MNTLEQTSGPAARSIVRSPSKASPAQSFLLRILLAISYAESAGYDTFDSAIL